MRIGLFTDTYRPSINGIVFVVESLKRELEALGHEVFIFCPAKTMRPARQAELLIDDEDSNIMRFRSIKGAFFDDYDTSIFFPPKVLSEIKKLNLDIIHIFTPSQIGLLGVKAAHKTNTPCVIQHCTDIYEFVEHYPAVLPGALAIISILLPFSVKLNGRDAKEIVKLYRPRRGVTQWNQDIIEKVVTILYSKADAVIALSRKSRDQLAGWQDSEYSYDITLLPNGVNPLPKPSAARVKTFRENWGIDESDEVFGFVGRLGEEKNLAILIQAFDQFIAESRPKSKLLFVGDFEYRATLEKMAQESAYGDRVIFTGAMPREELGVVYEVLNVFSFPSLKDTQGWVLHEAAHASKPIVIIDTAVSEVVKNGVSGVFVENTAKSLADGIISLLKSPKKRAKYGEASKKLASKYTEKRQIKKLERLYTMLIDERADTTES